MKEISFLKKLRRHDAIGLDWGAGGIKWLKLQTPGPGRHRITHLDYLPLPAEEEAVLNALKEYVLKKGLAGTPAAIAFQDETLTIRRLELPRMPPDDLQEAVRWQLRDIAEGSMDDYLVRTSLLEEIAAPDVVRLSLLGYAAKKSAIQAKTLLLQKAGLKPFFMEPAPVSLAHAVEKVYPSAEREWIGCVDIGFQKACFLAIGNGKLHFVRPLSGISLEQTAASQENYAAKVAVEIQHAIDAFSIAHQLEKIKRIFLAGGGAGAEELPGSLSKNLGVQTEVLNPLIGLEGLKNFPIGMEKPHLFGPALSLGLLQV